MSIDTYPKSIADLHIHSDVSDGLFDVGQILSAAKTGKLRTIALCDHHSTRGYDVARRLRDAARLNIIPGIEISTSDYKTMHILGLGMNNRADLDARFFEIANNNVIELFNMVNNLMEIGIELEDDFINEMIENNSIGRKKIAIELSRLGYVRGIRDAYKIVGRDSPLGAQTVKPSAVEANRAIQDAGGVACLAHPASIRYYNNNGHLKREEYEPLLSRLADAGLRGIECFPTVASGQSGDLYKSIATNLGLIAVGGSDFHGRPGEALGNPQLKQRHIDLLQSEIAKANDRVALAHFIPKRLFPAKKYVPEPISCTR